MEKMTEADGLAARGRPTVAPSRPLRCSGLPSPAPSGRGLLDHLVDAISVHDVQGTYLELSASFEALTGFPQAELIGRTPFELELFHPDDVDDVVRAQMQGLEKDEPFRVTYRLRRNDDVYIWVESLGRVIETPAGERFVVATRSSEIQTLLRGLEHERALALKLDGLAARQRAFLTAMNHRARTPVTQVLGYARLLHQLGDELGDERRARFRERLVASALDLKELVEDISDAAELADGRAIADRRVVDIGQLVDEVLADLVASAQAVAVDIPERTYARVDGDKVRRAVRMMLDNAFDHTSVGTRVRITVSTAEGALTLTVEDDGPGVPDEVKHRIFEVFERGDPDAADPGAGVGLYIVSEVAALHGGRAWVEDRPGGGSAFHLQLRDERPQGDRTHAGVVGPAGATGDRSGDGEASLTRLAAGSSPFVASVLESVRRGLDMRVAYLSIFVGSEQLIIAVEGDGSALGIVPGRRIPLQDTYCIRMVEGEVGPVVEDTGRVPILADLPATAGGLACYVGVPVHHPDGQVMGSLCCADTVARDDLPPSVTATLTALARLLTERLAPPPLEDDDLAAATQRIGRVLVDPRSPRVVYQPIVELASGRIAGSEALSRFDDDRPVDLWFADAARTGLLQELELKAAERALAGCEGLADGRYLGLNLSPGSIMNGAGRLLDGLPLERIVVEVTEHAAVDDYAALTAALAPLRERGMRLAIDDVGGGFSNFRHLVQLRPDIVKIDRSLIRDVATDPVQRAAAAAITRLADEIGADTVAEGLETDDALQELCELGVSHAQGYLLAEPQSTLLEELPAGRWGLIGWDGIR